MITLAEAIPLRKMLERRINELFSERWEHAYVIIEKGDSYEPYPRTMDIISEEIYELQRDYRVLGRLVTEANLSQKMTWNGEEVTLMEAIELAKQLRMDLNQLKSFSTRKKTERLMERGRRGPSSDASSLMTVALYDPEVYRQKALKLERQVNRLSASIEHQNHMVSIPFDASKYID
ncbi:hypothetical protein [Ammoniphilus sp. CFH 90114]|uniref:hypothetical protein n=1 Tax=Ammoniphilus sp. CFH 90114 TaxID=2493665 RepID=UPI00100F5622|nr:hypothetical protein [Ammoniphilus sp. CFH 90114]RXT07902.1 hypothetical protein EIZ39_10800 [Ammoniphilus sp. CFH 90114]